MEINSQARKMRDEFRLSIRRQKKEEIFRHFRKQNKVHHIEQQQRRMIHFLDTPQKREEWILEKAKQLSGEPSKNWKFILDQLLWSMLCFKGKGCFTIWIESGIIKNICQLFNQDYIELELFSDAARLLGNVIFLEQDEEQYKMSAVADEILTLEIVGNLLRIMEEENLTHENTSYFVTLLGNLFQNDPKAIIRSGAIRTCFDWSQKLLRDNKINRSYLQQIYALFDSFTDHLEKIPANFNFVIINLTQTEQLFKMYTEYLQIPQSPDLLKNVFGTMIKHFRKANRLVLQSPTLMKRLLELALSPQETIREHCWSIMAYVSSCKGVIEVFSYYEVINLMWQAYNIEELVDGNFDKITSSMLICIGNIAAENDDMRDQILKHQVMKILYDSTHPGRKMVLFQFIKQNIKKNAYYALCTFLFTKNYNLCRKILGETPIFQHLIFGMEHLIDHRDSGSIKEIIKALIFAIREDRKVYYNNDQDLLSLLNTKFFLINLLQKVYEAYHSNERIQELCEIVFDLFNNG